MCDTIVALKNSTKNSAVLFGKNSDREKIEPHIIIRLPRKNYGKGQKVKCTYIEIEQSEITYDCYLFKPSWIWGAEMGVNEFGVTAGNEAVFTNQRQGPDALLGMDILRLALERSKNAKEAVNNIIFLIEKYGQGGKCGYTKNLKYHNSFLIADFEFAFVLETAGKYWALKQVDDVRSISNALTIRNDYDLTNYPDEKNITLKQEFINVQEMANKIDNIRKQQDTEKKTKISKKVCTDKIDFKTIFENKLITRVASGDLRQKITQKMLTEKKGNLDVEDFADILRNHINLNTMNFLNGSMKNICMHGKSLISSETTGSFIVELIDGSINIFATGSSLPCLSIYKPLWFTKNTEIFFTEEKISNAINYWKKQRRKIEEVLKEKIDKETFIRENLEKEKSFFELAGNAKTEEEKEKLMKIAWEIDEN